MLHLATSNLIGEKSTWFWTMLQAVAIVVSLLLVLKQLRKQDHGNALAALQQCKAEWKSAAIVASRSSICVRFLAGNRLTRLREDESPVLSFFESLGLLVRREILDRELVWEGYSQQVEHYWPMLRPCILEFRAQSGDASWYTNFEYLKEALARVSAKKNAGATDKTEDALSKYARAELDLCGTIVPQPSPKPARPPRSPLPRGKTEEVEASAKAKVSRESTDPKAGEASSESG